jgi:hypothetical protein
MAKLVLKSTGVVVEVPDNKVDLMKRNGYENAEASTQKKKTGVKNESKSK